MLFQIAVTSLKMRFLVFFFLAYGLFGFTYGLNRRVLCYFESSSIYRPGNGKFNVSYIDPSLCSHVIYGFIGLNEDGSINVLENVKSLDDATAIFQDLVALKQINSDLKVMVSMGGRNQNASVYSSVAGDANKIDVLAKNILEFLEENELDGFDLDWEYPVQGQNITHPEDRDNFTALLKAIKSALKPKNYLLSVAVAGYPGLTNISYNVREVSDAVDYINVKTFNYHGSFDNYVGHHSAIYLSGLDKTDAQKNWNVNGGMTEWINMGGKGKKLHLGVSFYARTFTLGDPSNTALYAPITGGGSAQPYTQQEGFMGYNEFCEFYMNYSMVWDHEQKVPHYFSGDQWIGTEDILSSAVKAEYLLDKNLSGFSIWSLDTDDFRNICGNGTFPLLRSIVRQIGN